MVVHGGAWWLPTFQTQGMQGFEQDLWHPWLPNGREGCLRPVWACRCVRLHALSSALGICHGVQPRPLCRGVKLRVCQAAHGRSHVGEQEGAQVLSPARPTPGAQSPALPLLVLVAADRARTGPWASLPRQRRRSSCQRGGWGAVQDDGALQPAGLHAQLQKEAQGLHSQWASESTP